MRLITERLAALAAVLFLALALTQAQSAAMILVAVLVVAITATVVVGSRELAGGRAFAQRQARQAQPAPSHPTTAGRPRSRAPSLVVFAA